MTVAFFSSQSPRYPGAGGIRAKYLLKALNAAKIGTVRFLTLENTDRQSDESWVRLSSPISNENSILKRLFLELVLSFKLLFWIFKKRYSLRCMIISSPAFIPALCAGLFCKFFKIKYYLDIRDVYPEVYFESGLISRKSITYKALNKLVSFWYREASIIFVATKGISRLISEQYFVDTVLALNGFPVSLLDKRKPNNQRFKDTTIITHGILGRFQNVDLLCDLINHPNLARFKFIVIGYGPEFFKVEALTSPRCKVYSRMPYNEVIKIVSNCHIGLSLRDDSIISMDAFPVKVWEYIGLGLKVISVPKNDASEFIIENKLGIGIFNNNKNIVANEIVKLVKNKDKYELAIKDYNNFEITKFSRESICSEMIEKVAKDLNYNLTS